MKTPGTSHNYAGHGARRDTTGSPDSRIYIPSITSQEILDENASSGNKNRFGRSNSGGQRPGMNRKLLIVVALVVVAVAGAIVAFVVTKSNSSTSATNSSGANKNTASNSTASSTGSSSTDTSSGDTSTTTSSGSGDSSTTTVGGTIKSDPTTQTYSLTAFAIGDWGATVALNGSCCSRRKGIYNGYDWHAERGVVKLMDLTAQAKKPSVIISHGDNFYWTGIDGDGDRDYRFEQTFESRHTGTNMGDVPWINVMGNHDYGGGSYICMSDSGTKACGSADELVTALQKKFTLQSTYKSPNNDRWLMKDHFYKYTVTVGDITMDIFNLDMNDAESHGANEICCQCYSYTNGDDTKCKTQTRGGEYCIKGDTAMYDACVKQFNDWSDESLASLKTEVKKSTATWKIVNSHYNPYGHYGETSGKTWLTALKDLGDVHVWMAGHTHGEKHDYASFGTHFIENGAGGGIQSESASGIPPWATGISNLWTAGGLGDPVGNTYGFFVLDASKDWLKVRYQTFDDSWVMTKDGSSLNAVTKIGGVKTAWCYYIPNDGGKGKAC